MCAINNDIVGRKSELLLARDMIQPQDGYATYQGKRYILVDRRARRIAPSERFPAATRILNAVEENAEPTSPCYYPMTLLLFSVDWKRGGEALYAVDNGEYDSVMCEQKGPLTPHVGRNGRRCHDE